MLVPENIFPLKRWIRIAFINLLVVAVLGMIMRYKIAYSLPFIDQNNFLEAHSHFAFTGWATQVIMALMWAFMYQYLPADSLKKYKWLLGANLFAAYGMLVSFIWEGYADISIFFSAFSILVSWIFAVIFWNDLNKINIKTISAWWFKAALVFSVFSSLGVFSITYMVLNNIQQPEWLLASTYYFLHFQYNGWFFFACMGLLNEQVKTDFSFSLQKTVFWLSALSCVPAYFLSALWLPIPGWVYILVVLAAVTQLLGWIIILKAIIANKPGVYKNLSSQTKWLLILPAIGLSIKFLLQLGSTIPFLSKLAFGFRPVVIGYLHLMFLGVITLFIIGYCKVNRFLIAGKKGNAGLLIFVAGIILNEILLMIQGLSYMNYISVPYISESLLGAAVFMFIGVVLLITGLRKMEFT